MTFVDDTRARRNVTILVLAQAILGAQLPMIFVVGGLVGGQLASSACLATLPISFIVFGSMTTAPWLSPLMQRNGRRFGFFLGAFAGATGAAMSAYGLYTGSFTILLAGSYVTGIYMSAQGFYRFAATDTASEAFRPKAISYVMAGGLLSAIVGPQLNKFVQDAFTVPFLGTYLAIIVLNMVGMLLFLRLDLPKGTRTYAVGGVGPDNFGDWFAAGVTGFGIGSALYKPGMSVADIAERVGLSSSPCWRRIKRMEEAGIIQGRVTLLDRQSLGLGFEVVANVKLALPSKENLEAFENLVRKWPEVMECMTVTGAVDYIIRVTTTDMYAYDKFLREKLLGSALVSDVQSRIIINVAKRTTAVPLGLVSDYVPAG